MTAGFFADWKVPLYSKFHAETFFEARKFLSHNYSVIRTDIQLSGQIRNFKDKWCYFTGNKINIIVKSRSGGQYDLQRTALCRQTGF